MTHQYGTTAQKAAVKKAVRKGATHAAASKKVYKRRTLRKLRGMRGGY